MKSGLTLICLLFVAHLAGRTDERNRDDRKSEPRKTEAVTVPFEMLRTGHIAVMIKVNGKGPYRVIFDTGAPISLLSSKIAKEAALEKDPKAGGFSLFGMGGQSKAKTLEVGDARIENSSVIIMDHPTVKALAEAVGPLEGIIGFPVFARFKATLNYRDKTLTLVPNGFDPPDVLEAMTAAMMERMLDKKPDRQVLSPSAQWGMNVTKKEDDDAPGVTIKDVLPGGAADIAGLKAGDRLLTLDDRWTDSVLDTYVAAGFVKPRTSVKVVVKRGDKEKELTVKPVSGL
jgi:hypothetical protein